jgi:lysophospholipase L1-like esterase
MKYLRKLVVIVISLVVALFVCEGSLRLFFPQPIGPIQFVVDSSLGLLPVPNQKATRTLPGVYTYSYSNNSMGLRGSEVGGKTKPRILVLGDSFTYGTGVNDDETFCSILQQKLPAYEIINAGNGGKGTDYQLKFYRTVGRFFQPDLVLLVFFENDFMDNQAEVYYTRDLTPKKLEIKKPALTKSRVYHWLAEHSHLVNLLKSTLVSRMSNGAPKGQPRNDEITELYLSALKGEVPKLAVFYLPASPRLNGSPEENAFSQICSHQQIQLHFLRFAADDYFTEGHWKQSGHRKAADRIYSVIADSDLPGVG